MRRLQLRFGASVQTVGAVSPSPFSPDSARESWKLGGNCFPMFSPAEGQTRFGCDFSFWVLAVLHLLVGIQVYAAYSGHPVSHSFYFQFRYSCVIIAAAHQEVGGRQWWGSSYAGPINSHAEGALQETARDSSVLEHVPLMLQGMEANQMSHWVQASFPLGEGRSICRPEGLGFGSTQRLASRGKLLSSFLPREELTPCLCCGWASSSATFFTCKDFPSQQASLMGLEQWLCSLWEPRSLSLPYHGSGKLTISKAITKGLRPVRKQLCSLLEVGLVAQAQSSIQTFPKHWIAFTAV